MAWIKEYVIESTGVSGNYWEVESILYDHRRQKSILAVGCWVNEAAYNASKTPIHHFSYEIDSGLAPELAAGAIAFVTSYAMARPEFEGAELVE